MKRIDQTSVNHLSQTLFLQECLIVLLELFLVGVGGASSIATDVAQIIFMDGSLHRLPTMLQLSDEFEQTMNENLLTTVVPGAINIAGIYLLHTGIAVSVGIYYLGTLAGFGNTLHPLLKYQDENLSQPVTQPILKT